MTWRQKGVVCFIVQCIFVAMLVTTYHPSLKWVYFACEALALVLMLACFYKGRAER